MFGRIAASTLIAFALAGALLVPSMAEAKPSFLACSAPDYGPEPHWAWFQIYIGEDEEAASIRDAVQICRVVYGGHPVGAF